MKSLVFTILGFFALIFIMLVIFVIFVVGTLNYEAKLRTDFYAQQKVNESSFDKVWKVIQQSAGVAEQERESFRKTYVEIMAETKGIVGAGGLVSFLSQSKIDVTPELYSKLMITIESQRESFHRDQQKLLQLKAEHDKCFETQPSGIILSLLGRTERVKANIVTSAKTNQTFELGEDNDVDLFKNNN